MDEAPEDLVIKHYKQKMEMVSEIYRRRREVAGLREALSRTVFAYDADSVGGTDFLRSEIERSRDLLMGFDQ